MRDLTPVVWHEAMHLSQHHFQAQTRYLEDLAEFLVSELFFAPYGLIACEFDVEALRNDTLALRQARGVMKDGVPFQFPDEPPPDPRTITDAFSPTQTAQRVLLALPEFRPGRANCVTEEAQPTGTERFTPEIREVRDEVGGTDSKPVAFARKNFRLLLEGEDADGYVTLPIARVRRDGAGHFMIDRDFVPPCLQIGASERLLGLVRRLTEMLGSRSEALAAERDDADPDLAKYWLANTFNLAIGPLSHHLATRRAHPEQLYQDLLRLAGALCTFSMNAHPRDLPAYRHDALEECFGELERRILELMNVVAPSNAVRVRLRARGESYFEAELSDARVLSTDAEWFLAVRAADAPQEIAAKVPRLAKVCSNKFIERLVREAFPGLPIQHVPSPPPEISPRAGTQYFAIPKVGPCWASIVETREIGVYAPAAIPDAEIELIVAVRAGA